MSKQNQKKEKHKKEKHKKEKHTKEKRKKGKKGHEAPRSLDGHAGQDLLAMSMQAHDADGEDGEGEELTASGFHTLEHALDDDKHLASLDDHALDEPDDPSSVWSTSDGHLVVDEEDQMEIEPTKYMATGEAAVTQTSELFSLETSRLAAGSIILVTIRRSSVGRCARSAQPWRSCTQCILQP